MTDTSKEAVERPEMARAVGDVLRDIERAAANGEELADLIYDLARITKSVCAALDAAEAERQKMERENQLQAEEIDRTRRRSDKWQSMVLDCEEYLKPGETPRQRMDRDHAESLALMNLYQAALERAEAAEAEKRTAVAAERERYLVMARELKSEPSTGDAAFDAGWDGACDEMMARIRALSDTDALAEYTEKVRAEAFKEGVEGGFAAAIRQETNDG
jgi:hypothetical protein